jgi:hypothetical protein
MAVERVEGLEAGEEGAQGDSAGIAPDEVSPT